MLKGVATGLITVAAIAYASTAVAEQAAPAAKLYCVIGGAAIPIKSESECDKGGKVRRLGKHHGGAHVAACDNTPKPESVLLPDGRIAICR